MRDSSYQTIRRTITQLKKAPDSEQVGLLQEIYQDFGDSKTALEQFRAFCFKMAKLAYRVDERAVGRIVFEFAWQLAAKDLASGDPDEYALLHHPEVQQFIEQLAEEKNVIFIIGCAKSGTTLLRRCMGTARNPVYYSGEHALAAIYRENRISGENIIVKRRAQCHKYFDLVPEQVKILNIVRDPYYVLTSRATGREDFYVSIDRWIGEHDDFIQFSKQHPGYNLLTVRYEDLVGKPDLVQQSIQENLSIDFDLPFTSYSQRAYLEDGDDVWVDIDPDRQRTRRSELNLVKVLPSIDSEMEEKIQDFCGLHQYSWGRIAELFRNN